MAMKTKEDMWDVYGINGQGVLNYSHPFKLELGLMTTTSNLYYTVISLQELKLLWRRKERVWVTRLTGHVRNMPKFSIIDIQLL